MSVLVIGTGFVGWGIVQRLLRDHEVVLTWGQLDDADGLASFLVEQNPTAVVLAAGSPRHAGFQLDRRTLTEHVLVAECVARYAKSFGARIVLISSTAVLQPIRTGYGVLKFLVEHIVDGPRTVVLRSGTVVHTLNDRNQSVLHKFVRAAAAGVPLPVHDEAVGRLVYLVTRDQLAERVARSLTCSVPRGPSIVDMWRGSVWDLANLVRVRAETANPQHFVGYRILDVIDAMLAEARKEKST